MSGLSTNMEVMRTLRKRVRNKSSLDWEETK